MLSGDECYGDEITSGVFDEDESSFRGYCNEGDCLWSSNPRSNYSQAEGEVQAHLRSVHGLTDVSQVKLDIDET